MSNSPAIVAVTQPEYVKATPIFEASRELRCVSAPHLEADLAEFVRDAGAQHVVLGVEKYAGPLYEVLPERAVIARFGVGYDGVDLEAATKRRQLCTNTPGALDNSVAEHTIALLLAAARNIPSAESTLRAGEWRPSLGTELRGKRLAVVGCGKIGRKVARIASLAFGMEVIGCNRSDIPDEEMRRCGIAKQVHSLAEAVGADYISLHLPSTAATRHMIDAEALALMPPHAWLVNTSRGALVDELALYNALANSAIAGAALDVFEAEPYVPRAPEYDLRALPNVVLSPHVASSTQAACSRMAERALENIRLAIQGRTDAMDLLNPAAL